MAITIVSGLPRSGTSLMMQMLQAGGLPVLTDHLRPADPDNPLGYFEYEPVKALRRDNSWVHEAEGKVIKVISALLTYLPAALNYKVILMNRPMAEILASQQKMLQRLGRQEAATDTTALGKTFVRQQENTERWLAAQKNIELRVLQYHQAIQNPHTTAQAVAQFLGLPLNLAAMTQLVDNGLYRQRLPDLKEIF
jgi:hypothetical protein